MAEEEKKKEDIPEEKSEEAVEEKTEEASEETSKEDEKAEESTSEDEEESEEEKKEDADADSEDEKAEEEEKVENSKTEEIKTLAQAQLLLSKAADEIQSLKTDMKKLKAEVETLKPKADKYVKLIEKQKMEAVSELVKKKLSLGMIKKEEVEAQKEMLSVSKIKNIKLMAKELSELKPVIRKESLKGSESEVEEKSANVKKLMEGAGFKKEFVENYGKE